MLSDTRQYHVPLLLAFSVVTRIGAFFHIDTVTLGWRQSDLSSIAMNYLANGFRLAYPQIDWGGAGPGYVEMEFPIIPYLTAVLYKVFGVHDVLALVIPFVCGIGIDSLRSNSVLDSHLTSMYSSIIDRSDLLVFRLAEK
jgi:hypothetical protein